MEMKLRWQFVLIVGVPLAGFIVSLFWHPSRGVAFFLLFLWFMFFILLPTWKQLDRIEGKLDAISKNK